MVKTTQGYDIEEIIASEGWTIENKWDVIGFIDKFGLDITSNPTAHKTKSDSVRQNGHHNSNEKSTPFEIYLAEKNQHALKRKITSIIDKRPLRIDGQPVVEYKNRARLKHNPRKYNRARITHNPIKYDRWLKGKLNKQMLSTKYHIPMPITDDSSEQSNNGNYIEIHYNLQSAAELGQADEYTQDLIRSASNGGAVFDSSYKPQYRTIRSGISKEEMPIGDESEDTHFHLNDKIESHDFVPVKGTRRSRLIDMPNSQSVEAIPFCDLTREEHIQVNNLVSGIYRNNPLKGSHTYEHSI